MCRPRRNGDKSEWRSSGGLNKFKSRTLTRGLGLTDTSLHDPRPSCSVLTTSTYHEPLLPAPSRQGNKIGSLAFKSFKEIIL